MHHQNRAALQYAILQAYDAQYQRLSLNNHPDDWRQLIRYRNWKQIKRLHLEHCYIVGSDVPIVTNMEWPNLELLNLGSNNIGNIGTDTIWQKQWQNMSQLCLDRNKISSLGLRGMVNSQMQQLKIVSLSRNPIGSKGAELLTKVDMPLITKLRVCQCNLNNAGVKNLPKANWQSLEIFQISFNQVGYDGLCALKTFNSPNLNFFGIVQKNISNLGLFYAIAMNSKKPQKIEQYYHSNQFIKGDVYRILKMKFGSVCFYSR